MGKLLLLMTLLLSLTMNVTGQTVLSSQVKAGKEIEKANKAIISKLKKERKLKQVQVTFKPDGGWYLLLSRKDEITKNMKFGIANENGTVIVPICYDGIVYYPSLKEDTLSLPVQARVYMNGNFVYENAIYKFLQPQVAGVYSAITKTFGKENWWEEKEKPLNRHTLYNMEGERLTDIAKEQLTYFHGYFFSGPVKEFKYSGHFNLRDKILGAELTPSSGGTSGKYGLIKQDGTYIIPFGSVGGISIDYCNDDDSWHPRVYVGLCKYSIEIDSQTRKGAFMLNNISDSVPCFFNQIDRVNNKWEVKKNSEDDWALYTPDSYKQIVYRDKGEEYYEKKEYKKVVEFYSEEGVLKPWSKYFVARSYDCLGLQCTAFVSDFIKEIWEGDISSSATKWVISQSVPDFSLAKEMYELSSKYYSEYLKEDKEFERTAEMYLGNVQGRLSELPQLETDYKSAQTKYIALLRKKQQEEERRRYEENLARQQAEQLRAAQAARILLAVFNGFLNSSSTGNSGNNGASSYSSPATSTGVSSSSNSNNAAKIADWQSRKANAQRQLEKYQQQLIKDPNNAALKHNIRSTEEIIRTCDATLSTLR